MTMLFFLWVSFDKVGIKCYTVVAMSIKRLTPYLFAAVGLLGSCAPDPCEQVKQGVKRINKYQNRMETVACRACKQVEQICKKNPDCESCDPESDVQKTVEMYCPKVRSYCQ